MKDNELSGHKVWNVWNVVEQPTTFFPTARDYFAAAALTGLLANRTLYSQQAAKTALMYADALILELGKSCESSES